MKRMIKDSEADKALISDTFPNQRRAPLRPPCLDGPLMPHTSNVTISGQLQMAIYKAWRLCPALRDQIVDFSLLDPKNLCWDTSKADPGTVVREERNDRLRARARKILEINPGISLSKVITQLQQTSNEANRISPRQLRNILNPLFKNHRAAKKP